MENLNLYNKYRAVPETAKKPIRGGRTNGFTDINPMWRIQCLTEAFGPAGFGWYTKVIDKRIEGEEEEKSAFVDIELYVKDSAANLWSMPIYGTGGASFVAKERNGLYQSDEAFKMAYTDAISVACKALGIGADVYWEAGRTKYSVKEERTATKNTANKAPTVQDSILVELKRTGVGMNGILRKYGVPGLSELTEEQATDCLAKLKKMADKPKKEELKNE